MTTGLQIAVADDEPDMRDYLKKVLERLGHVVLGPVENGLLLVQLALERVPDLIITDIRMPEMSGDEAIRRIHSVRPTPYIVLSAFGHAEALAFETGAAPGMFLSKPVRKHDLQQVIQALMRGPSVAE